jgi:hypothetical protein
VEAYVMDICIELETLGHLTQLKRNESVKHTEIREVTAVEYHAALENARMTSKQLSLK